MGWRPAQVLSSRPHPPPPESRITEHVQAAGGVVLRGVDAHVEVLIIHRPKYDDWSLPKGKLHDGESHAAAAVREIREETGVEVRLERELTPISYRDSRGRPKTVRWWLAAVEGRGDWEPDDEVDEVRWVRVPRAHDLLSYEQDRDLLDQALSQFPADGAVDRTS